MVSIPRFEIELPELSMVIPLLLLMPLKLKGRRVTPAQDSLLGGVAGADPAAGGALGGFLGNALGGAGGGAILTAIVGAVMKAMNK